MKTSPFIRIGAGAVGLAAIISGVADGPNAINNIGKMIETIGRAIEATDQNTLRWYAVAFGFLVLTVVAIPSRIAALFRLAFRGMTGGVGAPVTITHPQNRAIVQSEWVDLVGIHNLPKRGHFWLFTVNGQDYWPATRINLHSDGRWKEKINVGSRPGPRTCTIQLMWADDFADALLAAFKERSNKAKDWSAIRMIPPGSQLSLVQSLILQVEITPPQ
jgi:hypothetical protein